jgi:hypothetical protein
VTKQIQHFIDGQRNVVDPGYTATDLNGHDDSQTVTEGTDAMVAMSTIGADGPHRHLHRPAWRRRLVIHLARRAINQCQVRTDCTNALARRP